MELYGKIWTRRELEARVGSLQQLGGIRRMKLTEGREAGSELIRVRTGAGLAYDITPAKGLDISLAELWGAPLSWQSSNGDVHPAYYEPNGTEWLRTASGGLLMTCGPSHVGSPEEDASGRRGLHGRAHHTPARQVNAEESWLGDELELRVSGVIEETSIFGDKLRVHRTIRSQLGHNRIEIVDRVENVGFRPAVHMMLYHVNFGFPLLGPQTRLALPPADLRPREPGTPMDGYDRWVDAPDPNATERVYYHRLMPGAADDDGMAEAQLDNPDFPGPGGSAVAVKVRLRWSVATLPKLVQWRMPGCGEHTLGLEPANCWVEGRAAEQANGGLVVIAPGEVITHRLELIIE
jgi:hypothetical protein